ncbi:uncharacterized protein LOC141632106 [Silene latifolia]|uniref:uncharacterized protein LOC141632106 n=1 Tax=Silene latifolia TaxID=37657 RepID=UPI003D76A700
MIDQYNPLAKLFRMVRDKLSIDKDSEVSIRLISRREKDGRTYNRPTVSEIAALIEGDIGPNMEKRDIIVKKSCGGLQRISELHPLYTPLQYPLLFPSGDDGYRLGILHGEASIGVSTSEQPREETTCREWFAYLLQDRSPDIEFPTLLLSGKAFHQFLVDGYMMVESHRLNYICFNQERLRVDNYKNLSNAVGRGDIEPSSAGARYIIPSSFPGGDKWKKVNYLDTMTICKWFGYPDLFITFTLVYTIEFQKRGLPHAHILLFLHREYKFPEAADVDKIISVEIPDPIKEPILHAAVCEYMLHGPCGKEKLSSPCMVGENCSKHYPKPCTERTTVDGEGYPIYKRSKKGVTVKKDGVPLGNEFVIPYNAQLLLKYQAHINIEWCNQSRSIKYLFKYINKGSDIVTMQSSYMRRNEDDPGRFDEIKRYYDCRYLSACEAAWRLFGFEIHYRTPAVERLQYHLPDEQPIFFYDDDFIDDVVDKSSMGVSQFLNWMACNNSEQRDIQVAKELLYSQFPTKEYIDAIKQAADWGSGFYLRNLFSTLLQSALQLTDEELKNYALMDIENSLQLNGSSLTRFQGMPLPDSSTTSHHRNTLVMDALSYDKQSLREENELQLSSMTDEQRSVYNEIMDAVLNNRGGVFFVYGYGGTGKTFIWRSLCSGIRSKGEIVVAVASSGIAATSIPGGVTAHPRLSIPLNVNEDSTCSRIKPGSDLTELLIRAKLIIWDEAPMTHKHSFEVVDKSLKDVMRVVNARNAELPFGGKVVVFGGDFRQTLPVVSKGSRADVVLRLTKNMRLQGGRTSDNVDDIRKFSEWLLEIGDGLAGGENDGEVDLQFPDDLLIQHVADPIASIKIDEEEVIYLSSDEVSNDDRGVGDPDLHSTEYLNSIKCSGLPNHELKLKFNRSRFCLMVDTPMDADSHENSLRE